MVNMISDILLGISAIVVAFVAIIGLSTWKRELAGKAVFEASKKMMGFAYKVVDGYQWTASLMTYSTESIDRTRQPGESDAVKRVLDEWYAKSKRMESVLKNYNKLVEANWAVRAILGQEAAKNIEEGLGLIKKEIVNLSTAIYSYFEIGQQDAKSGDNTRNTEFKQEMHKIVYQSPDSEEFKKLNVLVGDIDKELSPYLRGAGKLDGKPIYILKDSRFWAQIGIASGLAILFFGIQYRIVQPTFGWFDIISGIVLITLGFIAAFRSRRTIT